MIEALGDAQLQRAAEGYRRFIKIKTVASVLLFLVMVGVSVLVIAKVGLLVGLLVLFVGSPIAAGVVGPIIMLPIGYVVCGRDAMKLGVAVQQEKERRQRGY
jgi:type IV secretory pathway VirB3-like protein